MSLWERSPRAVWKGSYEKARGNGEPVVIAIMFATLVWFFCFTRIVK